MSCRHTKKNKTEKKEELIRKKQADARIEEGKVGEEREALSRMEERNHQKNKETFTQLISTMMIQAQKTLNLPIP